ncbi:TPA: DUF3368 domain-containing protein [Candidatus Woesearchaeota archaeon]|nr:DUF3368 domain-containing protein [Candidatus Woesearchaeota archaeon]
MPEKVVSNTSSLISLFSINRFHLLQEFYPHIFITEAVWKELTDTEKEGVQFFHQEKEKGFLVINRVTPSPFLQLLHQELDEGEAEAIALAMEKKLDLLLLDEKEARSIARIYKIPVTGTVGILMRAKREGKIPSLRKELLALREAGFWIQDDLFHEALHSCKEK